MLPALGYSQTFPNSSQGRGLRRLYSSLHSPFPSWLLFLRCSLRLVSAAKVPALLLSLVAVAPASPSVAAEPRYSGHRTGDRINSRSALPPLQAGHRHRPATALSSPSRATAPSTPRSQAARPDSVAPQTGTAPAAASKPRPAAPSLLTENPDYSSAIPPQSAPAPLRSPNTALGYSTSGSTRPTVAGGGGPCLPSPGCSPEPSA
jgi:hypothetical protein